MQTFFALYILPDYLFIRLCWTSCWSCFASEWKKCIWLDFLSFSLIVSCPFDFQQNNEPILESDQTNLSWQLQSKFFRFFGFSTDFPLLHKVFIYFGNHLFLLFKKCIRNTVGGKFYLIPCWFCMFAHWQRNDQSIILMVGLFKQWETE